MQGEITANGLIVGGMIGQRGAPGNGIVGIEKTGESGLVDTYTITYTDGTTDTIQVTNGAKGDKGDKGDQGIQGIQGVKGDKGDKGDTGEQGMQGIQGERGEKGEQGERGERGYQGVTGEKGDKGDKGDTGAKGDTGETGNGISSIEKTSTTGNVDTYTITFTDGTTTTFDVTNGADGNVTDVQVEGQSVVDNGVANITGLATQAELDRYKTIYNVLPKVTGTGETLTLNNTGEATLQLSLKGNTSQTGTPTPSSPIPINVVSGDNEVVVEGENLAYTGWAEGFVSKINNSSYAKIETYNNKHCLFFDRRAGYQEYDTKYLFKTNWKENTQYTIKVDYFNTGNNAYSNMKIVYTDDSETEIYSSSQIVGQWNKYSTTSQANKTIKYITAKWRNDSTYLNLDNFMVYEGTEEKPYQPYQSRTYPITLPAGTFMGAIGNYKDGIFHAINGDKYYDSLDSATKLTLTYGKWYLHKEIGKVVLDGSESWQQYTISASKLQYYVNGLIQVLHSTTTINIMSDIAKGILVGDRETYNNSIYTTTSGIAFRFDEFLTTNDLKTYLGTDNAIAYYVLAAPYLSLIEDSTLIEQLDNLESAMSYEGQTNISQTNDDKPFIIDGTALRSLLDYGSGE